MCICGFTGFPFEMFIPLLCSCIITFFSLYSDNLMPLGIADKLGT